MIQQGQFSRNNVHVGYELMLAPTDEAYRATVAQGEA